MAGIEVAAKKLPEAKTKKAKADPLLDDIYIPTQADLNALPDPEPLLKMLAASVVEVISGVRSLDQIATVVSDQVYEKLRARIAAKANQDAATSRPKLAPKFTVGKVMQESPKPGVVESVVLLANPVRTRAVTIRLESFGKRWRATNVSVL